MDLDNCLLTFSVLTVITVMGVMTWTWACSELLLRVVVGY